MDSDLPLVHLSAIDAERFDIRVARASRVTTETLPAVLGFCRTNGAVLLIARCQCSELGAAQAMEREGFSLMDTLLYCTRDLTRLPLPSDTGSIPIRFFRPGEEEAVRVVAAESLRGYFGHYHADDRLDRAQCDAAYVSWALRSCTSREVADDVLVAEWKGNVVGFFTLRLNSPDEGEAVIGGVLPSMQGHGVYRSFIVQGMAWCASKGAKRMLVSTQVTNVAVQKVWARLGFEPSHAYYTFHKWFDHS
jgi:GNAT superfamily N-acetyltransferase